MSYWKNKEERAKKAVLHTKLMEETYAEEIAKAAAETVILTSAVETTGFEKTEKRMDEKGRMKILLEESDSVESILRHAKDGKTAVLNFASYKNPGGMFLNGSSAQEESLCHESFLYNVLSKKESYYEWNQAHKNKALYTNRALYTPNVRFERNGKSVHCDVITCAAPNKHAAQTYQHVSDEENLKALKDRIQFVVDIANSKKVDILILGAFGCGVFGQAAEEAAECFAEALKQMQSFDTVVFAIPSGPNLNAFRNVFEK